MSAQPNILFMIADDHRWDAIGGMGDPTVKTPTPRFTDGPRNDFPSNTHHGISRRCCLCTEPCRCADQCESVS